MQGILETNLISEAGSRRTQSESVVKIGVFGKIFGCWHKRLTRPFTDKNVTYRSCLECGARKNFNTQSFKTSGPFYYPPSVKPDTLRQVT